MPELHMEAIPPHPEPQSWRSHTQETLSSDDLPAEILVPTLLYNPLPLQCLAADALPIQIKEEIDQITSEYGDMDSEQLQVPASPTSTTVETQEEDKTMLVLKRHLRNGYGLRFIGGVKCENGKLHAQVTCVLPESVPKQLEPLKSGACIMAINGKSLTGATFEQVKITLNSIEKEVIEITYRTYCSKPIEVVARHRNDCRSSPQRKKKPPNFLPVKQPGSKKSKAKKATDRMSGLIPSPVTEGTVSSSNNSGSVGPSLKREHGRIILNHPNNMIQISMRYSQQQNMFFVSLHKFNGHCSPSWLEQSGVFLNTYLIPDKQQSLGVRHAMMVSPTASTDELLEQSASYCLSASELKKYSLRLIVWESGRGLISKKPILHGEVFLLLSDNEKINLHGVPQWYNVSPPDPNLPAVPKPYQLHKQPIDRVFNKMKSSLTVAQNAGTNTLRRMMKGGDSAKRSISLQNMSTMSSSPSNLSSILDTLRDNSTTSEKSRSNTAPEEMTKAMFSFLAAYEDDDPAVSSEESSSELSIKSSSSETPKRDSSFLTTSDVHLSLKNAKEEEGTDLDRASLLALIASLNHQPNSANCSVHPSSEMSLESFEESSSSLDSSSTEQRVSNSWASPVLSHQRWSHDETDAGSLELHNPLLPSPSNRFMNRHRSQTVPVSSPQHQTDLENSFRASLISSPVSNPLSCSSPHRIKQSMSLGDMTDIEQQDDEDNVESSLDFPHHQRQQLNTEDHCTSLEQSGHTTPTQTPVITRKTEQKQLLSKSLESSCLETHSQTKSIPTRWNSVDNLLNQSDSPSTRKKSWVQKIMFRRSIDNSINTGKRLAAAYSKGKPVGNIKVQLTATNHNATALNVKVLSALFFKDSTTNSSVVVKASTFSNITDTCEHKQKTLTKLQHNHELSPPSVFTFLANPQDYSLQIVLVQGTQVFGHKSYSHAWVNLSKAFEPGASNQTTWLQLRKLPLSF